MSGAPSKCQHQTAVRAEHGAGARKFQPDLFRIRARRYDEIVFELALGSVIDQIDAPIDLLIVHFAESADAIDPFVGIVADESSSRSRGAHRRRRLWREGWLPASFIRTTGGSRILAGTSGA